MWKIVVGFLVIAALAIWLLSKGGDVDISGEKHSVEPAAPAAMPASAAAMPASASAASAPASAASN